MKKDDDKVLKRILFLFVFVFACASIILLSPSTLTKLQGNASAYKLSEAKHVETGVVITTDYLIENLSDDGTLSIYNGANSDIKITNFISKKIDSKDTSRTIDYAKTAVNIYVPSKKEHILTFDKKCLGGTYDENGCTSTNDILKLNDKESIGYKNLVVGIEYELNGEIYYLVSTALYLDTTRLASIANIRNIDNSKSDSVSHMSLSINDAKQLVMSSFLEEEYSKFKEINLNDTISGTEEYEYINSYSNTVNIKYDYNYNKYLFVDISEKLSDDIDFELNNKYTIKNLEALTNKDTFAYFTEYLIVNSDSTSENNDFLDINIKDYSPNSNVINLRKINNHYNINKYSEQDISKNEYSYSLYMDSNVPTFSGSIIFLERKDVITFHAKKINDNKNYKMTSSPIYVMKYNKEELGKAIKNGISKLGKAKEDSIEINSYQDYTNILFTAIDLYSSRYIYDVNGKDYLVTPANIYQMTKILNEYKFEEKTKADYTEIKEKMKVACDALTKFESTRNYGKADYEVKDICASITGKYASIKSVSESDSYYLENTNALRDIISNLDWDLSLNYNDYLKEKAIQIDNNLRALPVYTDQYMKVYESAPKENKIVKTMQIKQDESLLDYFSNKFISIADKMNKEHITITLDELISYVFNEYTYDDIYEEGPDTTKYSQEVWDTYYNELKKYYKNGNKPDFTSKNFLDNQADINEATEKLTEAINTLKANETMVDNSFTEDMFGDDIEEYLFHMSQLYSKEVIVRYSEKARILATPIPLDGVSIYNGKEVSNQVYFYNNYFDLILYNMYDQTYNLNFDGLFKDGRNSRKELGYLSVEEYYDFFYNFNYEDYELESIKNLVSKEEFKSLVDGIDIIEENLKFVETFDEWYIKYSVVRVNSGGDFTERQSTMYTLQEIFRYLKSLLVPKVGDYTEVCNYYKVLTTLNLYYYSPETEQDIVNILWEINWSYKKDEQEKIDEQAKNLKDFIDNLSMRKADTSKLYQLYNAAIKYDKKLYSNYDNVEEAISGFKYLNDVYIDRQDEVDALANKINNAINNLVLKKADYSKIEYMKGKISTLEKDKYENYYLLEKALDEVVYGLDITKQADVDVMYTNILNAYEDLKINGNLPGNYDEYKNLVEKLPTFVKDYDTETQDKINSLMKEIEEFPMDLKLKDQTKIDNMTSKIQKLVKELNIGNLDNIETVNPTDTSLIKTVKINNNAIDISRMPFEYSVGYSDTTVDIEVEVIKNAKVYVYGGSSLFYGENNITIQVIYLNKAYNYKLNIYRKSSSNYLKALKIHTKGASFNSENFNKEKQDYVVKIDNDTTRLDIEAIPEEETARINIKNNYKLKDDSRIQIEVTSKDGSFRVYTLIIKKTSVVNYRVLIVLAVIFILLAFALKGLQNLSKKKVENE